MPRNVLRISKSLPVLVHHNDGALFWILGTAEFSPLVIFCAIPAIEESLVELARLQEVVRGYKEK